MRPSIEHPCAQCHAVSVRYGAQVFIPLPCASCGTISRPRAEIAGYQLHEILARSGLAVTLRATDAAGGTLAVKLVQPPLVAHAADLDYFVSEVWALARLNHPNYLRIFAAGAEQGVAWIAMEWLGHGSLARRIAERGRLREAEVLAIGAQAASALGAAHAAGHVHRDVEPNNLVFASAHVVKLTDFGQAALYQITGDDLGTMWGRAYYVSPERLRNEPEDAPSDIYALGATLVHALTGIPLHDGEPHGQLTLDRIESEEIRLEGLISPLHEKTALVLQRMLASEPSQRFQYWSEVAAQLTQAGALVARREASATRPPRPPAQRAAPREMPRSGIRFRGAWATFALLVVIIPIGLVVWKTRQRSAPPPPAAAGNLRPALPPIPAAEIAPAPQPVSTPGSSSRAENSGTEKVSRPFSAASPPRSPQPRSGSPPSSPPARVR